MKMFYQGFCFERMNRFMDLPSIVAKCDEILAREHGRIDQHTINEVVGLVRDLAASATAVDTVVPSGTIELSSAHDLGKDDSETVD